jgi:ADP-heptose:LPS heptosyltransferase
LGPAIDTFADTATIIRQLDLVISIDTGPAHLAGALRRPVWLLLSAACDSRWYDCQHYTPWYDSMRLYRQETLGDWAQPVESIIADLLRLHRS